MEQIQSVVYILWVTHAYVKSDKSVRIQKHITLWILIQMLTSDDQLF